MALDIVDTSRTKYRVRKCCKCPNGLEYICLTCFCDLCSECRDEHVDNKLLSNGYIHTVIEYREQFENLKNHEICLRHQNSVYDEYCEFCNTPICPDCTDHRTHTITDLKTAYETKRRHTKWLIKNIEEDVIFCFTLFGDIVLDFKLVSDDVTNINSELLILSKNLTGCIDNVLQNISTKSRCLKQKTEMKRCIARTQTYEHVYEHSSIVPIKFLLSVKKTHPFKMNNMNVLKHHCKATLSESTIMEYIIEKLPKVKLSSQENRIQSTTSDMGLIEKMKSRALARTKNMLCVKSPQSALTNIKCYKMLFPEYPILLQAEMELEKPLLPIGVGPVEFQGKRKFRIPASKKCPEDYPLQFKFNTTRNSYKMRTK